MKHQISIVGSQLLPIYIGIKEFKPDRVHLIVSDESISGLNILRPLIKNTVLSQYKCNPFDFYGIKDICERIIEKMEPDDSISFNLTSGTKIMLLACQSVIHEKGLQGFYINQDDSLIALPSYEKTQITCDLTIQEFFEISGHNTFLSKKLEDFSKDDISAVSLTESFCNNDKRYASITSHFRRKYNNANQRFPVVGKELLGKNLEVTWNLDSITIKDNGKRLLDLKSKNVINIFFNAAWWEIKVAQEIAKWGKLKELLINCELPFKTDLNSTKNEIDILLNTGNKLIFVECKSGNIKQEDINKMKVIKQTYGGVISKSILVSRFLPSSSILEKCKELDIEVFYSIALNREINPLSKLQDALNNLNRKGSI